MNPTVLTDASKNLVSFLLYSFYSSKTKYWFHIIRTIDGNQNSNTVNATTRFVGIVRSFYSFLKVQTTFFFTTGWEVLSKLWNDAFHRRTLCWQRLRVCQGNNQFSFSSKRMKDGTCDYRLDGLRSTTSSPLQLCSPHLYFSCLPDQIGSLRPAISSERHPFNSTILKIKDL